LASRALLTGGMPQDRDVATTAGMPADAAMVACLLGIPEAVAAQLLDDLEATGCLVSAVGPVP